MNKSLISAAVISFIGLYGTAQATDTALVISGQVEVELTADSIAASTVGLGVSKQVNDMVSTEMSLLYEGATTDIDTASITIAPQTGGWHITTGQFFLPFGSFNSNMISDPITLEMAETGANALQIGYEDSGFGISAYTAAGASSLDTMGANINYHYEKDSTKFGIDLGYTTNLGKSAGISADGVTDAVIGQSIMAMAEMNGFSLVYENIAATTAFTTGALLTGNMPVVTNIELAYGFDLGGKETTVAVAAQSSEGANDLFAKTRNLFTFSSMIMQGTSLGLEYKQETDYASTETTAITAKLAVEF